MGRGLDLEVKGLKETVAAIDKVSPAAKKKLEGVIQWGTSRLDREVKILATRKVKVRSGRYRSSITAELLDNLTGRVGSNLEYAGMIEFGTKHLPGGVLKPRNSRFLAIPLDAAKTAAGVPRSPKDYIDTFVKKGPSGNLIIWGRKDLSTPDPVPLFALVTQVTIKGRGVFREARGRISPTIVRRAQDAIAEVTR